MKMTRGIHLLLLASLAAAPIACGGDQGSSDQRADVDRELDLALSADTSQAELADVPSQAEPEPEPAPPPRHTPPPRRTRPAPQPRTPPPAPAPAPAPQPTPQPQPAAVAQAPAPAPAPAPTPAAPTFETMTVPNGTPFEVTLDQEISTKTSRVGDLFTATVKSPVTDGSRVIIPAGTKVRGEVTEVKRGKPPIIKVAFNDITVDGESYPLSATITGTEVQTKGSSTGSKAAKIGGAAVIGGILGRVIGGNSKGTLIGAAAGGAAGTAATLGTEKFDAILAFGSTVACVLDQPLTVRRRVASNP